MYKKDIINFLYVLSFPLYGVGAYISSAVSPTVGYVICSVPFVLIVLFHLIDLLYKKEFELRLNSNYLWMLLFIATSIISLVVAYNKNLPEFPMHLMLLKALFIFLPFHGFVVVNIYNHDPGKVVRLTFISFSILLLINIVGFFGLGMTNLLHYIEGRFNFPFMDGLYSVACLLAILNLMLLYFARMSVNRPITLSFFSAYFFLNLLLFYFINSRLCILVFVLVVCLMLLHVRRGFRWVFITSLFTLPIIIGGSLIIYEILSLPFFKSILQRVDYADIVTFNGRTFLWENVFDWLRYDREGLIFGNGYQGHYFLDLLGGLGKIFDLKGLYSVHLHSVPLEILVSQGLVGLILFFIVLYRTFDYFRRRYQLGSLEGAFFPVVLFLIFIIHMDANGYMNNSAGLILALLTSCSSVKKAAVIKTSDGLLYPLNGIKTAY